MADEDDGVTPTDPDPDPPPPAPTPTNTNPDGMKSALTGAGASKVLQAYKDEPATCLAVAEGKIYYNDMDTGAVEALPFDMNYYWGDRYRT